MLGTNSARGYGLSPVTPVCTGIGPRGINRYCRHLRCPGGAEVQWRRLGAVGISKSDHVHLRNGIAKPNLMLLSDPIIKMAYEQEVFMIDRYEINCNCGAHRVELYVDTYDIADDICVDSPGWAFV